MEMIDIGVNLMSPSFDEDREAVIQRALDAGVSCQIITGTSKKSSLAAQRYAARHPGILFSTAGVHPHDAKHCDETTIALLRDLAAKPEVVAIGECGLDFNRDFSPRPLQETWFEAQIALACDLKRPVFLHERDAHERFLAILRPYRDRLVGGVIHCFTGSGTELKAYLELDLHVGITGWICDERRGTHLRDLVRKIPLERLMLETDAPYLTPRDLRPKPERGRNEPSFLPHILRTVATCLRRPPADVAAATSATTRTFFRLPSAALSEAQETPSALGVQKS